MCLQATLELVGHPPSHDFRLYWTSPWFSCAKHHPWADGEFEIGRKVIMFAGDIIKPFLARAEYRNGKWIWLGKEIDMSPYFFRGLASKWEGE
jgi:hypothetical protein